MSQPQEILMTTPTQTLIFAKSLLLDPANWIVCALYADEQGESVDMPEAATKFCTLGAVFKAAHILSSNELASIEFLSRALPGNEPHVANYNDSLTTTHADILALFDRAIELSTQEVPSNDPNEYDDECRNCY